MERARSPRVTVGIPVRNGAATIGAVLESVLEQDYEAFEILVADNASTDDTLAVVDAVSDDRLRVLTAEADGGAGWNWNRVLTEALGEYVKVLSADDVLLPGSLGREVAALDGEHSAVLACAPRIVVTSKGRRLATRGFRRPHGLVSGAEAARAMVRSGTNLVGEPSATLIRRSALDSADRFDEASPYCVDMDLWFRLLGVGDLVVLQEPSVLYRVATGSWTQSAMDRQAADVEQLLRSVVASGAFGLDDRDVRRGILRARLNAQLRRLLYAMLSVSSGSREKIAYVLVGGWNTAFGYLVFSVFWWLFGAMLPYFAVLVASYVVTVVNAYVCYRVFVFRSKASVRREFPRFLLVYGVTLIANLVAFPALVTWLDLSGYAAQALFTVFVVIVSYIANRNFAFTLGREEG